MSGGVASALAEAVETVGAEPATVEGFAQAGLFEELDTAITGALDAPSPLLGALKPRRGRPPGARNVRTLTTAKWLLSQHRHPLDVMAEAYGLAPAELLRRIGLRDDQITADLIVEAYKLQLRMAEAVAPYVASKMPLGVAIDQRARLELAFSEVSFPARGEASEILEGEAAGLAVNLAVKSDAPSRTDGAEP